MVVVGFVFRALALAIDFTAPLAVFLTGAALRSLLEAAGFLAGMGRALAVALGVTFFAVNETSLDFVSSADFAFVAFGADFSGGTDFFTFPTLEITGAICLVAVFFILPELLVLACSTCDRLEVLAGSSAIS